MGKTSQRLSHQTKSCQSSQTQNTKGARLHLRLGTDQVLLILTILTVVSLFPYLFWGMRNGSCHFSVYMLFLGIPWTYPDVLYIAGKIFLRGIQRSWNRGKRFRGDGVIRETSLTIMAHRGG